MVAVLVRIGWCFFYFHNWEFVGEVFLNKNT